MTETRVMIFEFPELNAKGKVTRPGLPEEEYNRRFKRFHDATADLLREAERVRREQQNERTQERN